MSKNLTLTLLAGLLASGPIAAADLSAIASAKAEPLPYGHPDFVPTSERPIGFRGNGSGHFPGATPPSSFSEKDGKNVRWSIKLPSWSQST